MVNEMCPKCNRKSLRYRGFNNSWICSGGGCYALFDGNMRFVDFDPGDKILIDKFGNVYAYELKREGSKITEIRTHYLEEGKTTFRGEYPKLEDDLKCKYPERLDCNGGLGYRRCGFMEYGGTPGNWYCIYNKQ